MVICPSSQCTGCGACAAVCHVKAIDFADDIFGFPQPLVNEERCDSCGRCAKLCPANATENYREPRTVLAAWHKDTEQHEKSATGGVAAALTKKMLQEGGAVYSASMDDGLTAVFHCAQTWEEAVGFAGSKYVASNMRNSYQDLNRCVQAGQKGLFIGLPCQVAGLLTSVPERRKDELLTVDLICHGTPAAAYLREHLRKQYGKDAKVISFRNQTGAFFLNVSLGGKRNICLPSSTDSYYYGFLKGLFYRESCYSCRYAQSKRVSDITLGDFWGLGDEIPYPYPLKKTSAVLINTEKGARWMANLRDELQMDERTLAEALNKNEQLRQPFQKPETWEKFMKIYARYGFEKAARAVEGQTVLQQKIRWELSVIKRKLIPKKTNG
jgi:coenzyme F420-reducing hydrogenase beta subunit